MKKVFNELAYLLKLISIEDPKLMIDSDIEDVSDSTTPVIEESTGP